MGALYLASKMEETPRRAVDVINVFHRCKQRRRNEEDEELTSLDPSSRLFERWKSALLAVEGALLKELGFDL